MSLIFSQSLLEVLWCGFDDPVGVADDEEVCEDEACSIEAASEDDGIIFLILNSEENQGIHDDNRTQRMIQRLSQGAAQ